MADGTLIFDTRIDTDGFQEGANTIKNQTAGLVSTMKKFGRTLAGVFALGKMVQLGKEAIDFASDMQEVQNVVDTAFGEMSYKMEEFAETAVEMYGISKLSAKQTGSTFMAMAKGMGLATDSASDMALALTGLSADMASFYNVEQDVASTALNSIFTGETETLKQYGIVMTELNLQEFAAAQGIKKKVSAMTQAEKVQLRYNYVMSQTALAQGDFAKTSSSWANQTRILAEQWKEFLGILGNGLIQVLTPVVQFLNAALSQLISIANAVGSILGKVFGLTKSSNEMANATANIGAGASSAGSGIGELADETEAAGKKINKSLSSFDDLNQITQSTASNASSASSGIGSTGSGFEITEQTMDTSSLETGTSKIVDIMEPLLALDFEPLRQSIENFKESLLGFSGKVGEGLKWIYDNVLVPLAAWSITDAVPAFLDLLSAALDVFSAAAEALSPIVGWFFDTFLAPLASWTGGVIVAVLETLAEKLEVISKWISDNQETVRNMAATISTFFAAWKITKLVEFLINANGVIGMLNKMRTAFWGLALAKLADKAETLAIIGLYAKDFVIALANSAKALISQIIKLGLTTAAKIADTAATIAMTVATTAVTAATWLFNAALAVLTSPITYVAIAIAGLIAVIVLLIENWDTVKETAVKVWEKVTDIFKTFDTYLTTIFQTDFSASFGAIGDVLNSFFANAENIWTAIKNIFTGMIDFITGTFTLDWKKAWSGIVEVFGGVFELIVGLAKSPINLVIGLINGMIEAVLLGVNTLIRAVNKIKFTAPSWVPGIGGQSFGFNLPEVTASKIPYLATGTVIPPNSEFLAVLGDQKHGVNIEAPLETIVEAFQQVAGNQKIVIQFTGNPAELVRWLKPELDKESARRGTQLVVGGV